MFGKLPAWLQGSILLQESGEERNIELPYEFADPNVARRLFRWTGGSGLMSPADGKGLEIVEEGFRKAGAFAEGYHILGGTRMRGLYRPEMVVPGIMELPIRLKKSIGKKMRLLGLAPKVSNTEIQGKETIKGNPIFTDQFGTVISINFDENHPYGGYFTTLRGDTDVTIFFQPGTNQVSKYDDERLRAREIIDQLLKRQMPALLTSYNGGGVTEREIRDWCRMIENRDSWRECAKVLLIKDSGRITHQLACDQEFLGENPWVSVAELDSDHIAECVRKVFEPRAT